MILRLLTGLAEERGGVTTFSTEAGLLLVVLSEPPPSFLSFLPSLGLTPRLLERGSVFLVLSMGLALLERPRPLPLFFSLDDSVLLSPPPALLERLNFFLEDDDDDFGLFSVALLELRLDFFLEDFGLLSVTLLERDFCLEDFGLLSVTLFERGFCLEDGFGLEVTLLGLLSVTLFERDFCLEDEVLGLSVVVVVVVITL
jgi:hypothetical protein